MTWWTELDSDNCRQRSEFGRKIQLHRYNAFHGIMHLSWKILIKIFQDFSRFFKINQDKSRFFKIFFKKTQQFPCVFWTCHIEQPQFVPYCSEMSSEFVSRPPGGPDFFSRQLLQVFFSTIKVVEIPYGSPDPWTWPCVGNPYHFNARGALELVDGLK